MLYLKTREKAQIEKIKEVFRFSVRGTLAVLKTDCGIDDDVVGLKLLSGWIAEEICEKAAKKAEVDK